MTCILPAESERDHDYRRVPGNTKKGLYGKVPPEFLRTAEWKPQLSGRTSRKKLKVSYRDNREAQEVCGFFTENRRKTSRLEEGTSGIEKRVCYISDWTRLLTSQMVNSWKRKDHQGGKKDRIIPVKVNRHIYTKLCSLPCFYATSDMGLHCVMCLSCSAKLIALLKYNRLQKIQWHKRCTVKFKCLWVPLMAELSVRQDFFILASECLWMHL